MTTTSTWLQLAIGIAALWMVWRFVGRLFSRPEPSGSVEGPSRRDPLAGVPAPKKRNPQNRSGAVALAEPDEEDENRSFPPRTL
jgi:hypothetical protein